MDVVLVGYRMWSIDHGKFSYRAVGDVAIDGMLRSDLVHGYVCFHAGYCIDLLVSW